MDIKWKLYKLWKCEYESPMQAANGAAVVQIGKVKYLSVNVIPHPNCVLPCDYIQYITCSPDMV